MDLERLKRDLRLEIRQYLADLRAIRDELRSAEGWFVLGLVVAAGLITVAWGLVSLGFSPPNEHVMQAIRRLGLRECRTVSNLNGVIIFINLFLLLFLTLVSLGNAFNMISRIRRGFPREPRDLVISTALMLAVGIGGIVYMMVIC